MLDTVARRTSASTGSPQAIENRRRRIRTEDGLKPSRTFLSTYLPDGHSPPRIHAVGCIESPATSANAIQPPWTRGPSGHQFRANIPTRATLAQSQGLGGWRRGRPEPMRKEPQSASKLRWTCPHSLRCRLFRALPSPFCANLSTVQRGEGSIPRCSSATDARGTMMVSNCTGSNQPADGYLAGACRGGAVRLLET